MESIDSCPPESTMGAWGRCLFLLLLLLLFFFFADELGISRASATEILLRCREKDRKALMEFKRLFHDPSNRLSSWAGEDCCAWEGVGCDNTTSNVFKLDLRLRCDLDDNLYSYSYMDSVYTYRPEDAGYRGCKQELHGDISSSLLSLQQLTHLDLSGNYFGHRIPAFLGSLTALKYLNLSNAGFTGRVPDQLGNLSSLFCLDLSDNFPDSYGGEGLYIENPGWISHLSSLQILKMNGVNFTGTASNLLQALNALPLIREVELESCGLRDFPHLLPHLNFTTLTALNLKNNYDINSILPDWFFNITTLEYVDLGGSSMDWPANSSIVKLSSLKALDLSGNMLSDGFFQGALSNLCMLRRLYLISLNVVTSDLLSKLQAIFSGCLMFSLEEFDLSHNQLKGPFPLSLGNMRNLKHLDLSDNLLYGSPLITLANLSRLQYLDLSYNEFTRTTAIDIRLDDSFSNLIGNMKNLEVLDLSHNSFYGSLPLFLGEKLKMIDFSYNSFYGSLPTSFGKLSSLHHLNFHSNSLNGSIGEVISQLKDLIYLDLGNNSFDIFEAHFANLSSLKYLDISHNTLILKEGGDWIPEFQLRTLVMSFCRIIPIPYFPEWLRMQKSLIGLFIESAGIKGIVIPNLLPASLGILSLSNNDLSGHIPEELQHLRVLQHLDLSRNYLIGEIPSSICRIKRLTTLDLSRNYLSGIIPSSLTALYFLETLDLSYNNLSGRIPTFLSSFQSLMDDPSIYTGNPYLCGSPLAKNCTETTNINTANDDEEDDQERMETIWLYTWTAFGFILGFWTFWGTLTLKQRWRILYFQTINNAYDRMYVMVAINMVRIKRKRTVQR